jgi:hypothetical protein
MLVLKNQAGTICGRPGHVKMAKRKTSAYRRKHQWGLCVAQPPRKRWEMIKIQANHLVQDEEEALA